jgi:hypothetical protein
LTTIAWDGRYVAADTLMISGSYKHPMPYQKLRLGNGVCYGLTGYAAWFDAWIKWYEAGADPAATPACNISDGGGAFIVLQQGTASFFTREMPYAMHLQAPDAWGSGAEYAIGAMMADASAIRAIDIAIRVDHGTGGKTQAIDLQTMSEVVD